MGRKSVKKLAGFGPPQGKRGGKIAREVGMTSVDLQRPRSGAPAPPPPPIIPATTAADPPPSLSAPTGLLEISLLGTKPFLLGNENPSALERGGSLRVSTGGSILVSADALSASLRRFLRCV